MRSTKPERSVVPTAGLHGAGLPLALLACAGAAGCTSNIVGGTGGASSSSGGSGGAVVTSSATTGGAGGAGKTTSTGTGGTGGAGGCSTVQDCPGTNTACATRTCAQGSCGTSFVAAGMVATAQTPGNCQKEECDGTGNVVGVPDPTDVPVSSNACVVGSCAGATPMVTPLNGAACNQNGGKVCDNGVCVQCASGADCTSGVCVNGQCQASSSSSSSSSSGTGGAPSSSSSSSSSSSGTVGPWTSTCPGPPAGGPTGSWADCSVGLDPTKNGGDLLWAEVTWDTSQGSLFSCGLTSPWAPPTGPVLALGPTGDIAWGHLCNTSGTPYGVMNRWNGSGAWMHVITPEAGHYPGCSESASMTAGIDRHNNLAILLTRTVSCLGEHYGRFEIDGPGVQLGGPPWPVNMTSTTSPQPFGPQWDGDVLGNFFVAVRADQALALDSTLNLPGNSTSLVRGGAMGESFQPAFSGSLAADQTGGVYRFGALPASLDAGCGPMVPTSASSGYLARLGPSWGCVYGRVLPTAVGVIADTNGGAVLQVTSAATLDLGCGPLPAAPGGSTFVTRLDGAGACVFGKSVPAPDLTVALDSGGRVVLSGVVGAAPVDLGGGPLAPFGSQDFVLAELDVSGNHLWSKRFGGPGITFASPTVSTSASGDVYLKTGWSGAVDLGGGPIAANGDMVVGSFSPSGAHRWSRAFHVAGFYQAGLDGCGSLVVVSNDPDFDPGCGKPFAPEPCFPPSPCNDWGTNMAVARFAP